MTAITFYPENDHLTLTLADGSATPAPPEVHIASLTQLPCLYLTPHVYICKEHKALTSKCHHSDQSCHCPHHTPTNGRNLQ